MTQQNLKELEIGGMPWLRADSEKEGTQVQVEFVSVEMTQGARPFPKFLVSTNRSSELCHLSGWSIVTGVKMLVVDFIGKKAVLTSTGKKWLVKFA